MVSLESSERTLTVEVGDHFGHTHLLLRALGHPTKSISLADPRGNETLARVLIELAAGQVEGKENL